MGNHSILSSVYRSTHLIGDVQHVLSLDDPDREGHVGQRDIDSDTKGVRNRSMCVSFRRINRVRLTYVLTSHTFVRALICPSICICSITYR